MPSLRESLDYTPNELQFGTSGLRALASDMTDLECYINTTGFLRFLEMHEGVTKGEIVYVAGDLRDSTPRITRAVMRAVADHGHKGVYCGLVPTPTVSLYGFTHVHPSIMVTGSHIPADRNGIKFVKPHDEVLKEDEQQIKATVAKVREQLYAQEAGESLFSAQGMLRAPGELPPIDNGARDLYMKRYTDVFDGTTLLGRKIVFYQHSAVGRDLLPALFEQLGATVVTEGRSEVFIPIDSENVTAKDRAYFHELARKHPDALAIVSTDGDSDRPFVIDETGEFHRGDMLGVVVAQWLKADFATFPVSASDAADKQLTAQGIEWKHTRIGSPYVVASMKQAQARGKRRVVGWEVNGGFLLEGDLDVNGGKLARLPTRDAFVAILGALETAVSSGCRVSEVFNALPQRFTQAGLINDFPPAVSREMERRYRQDSPAVRAELERYFTPARGFGRVTSINTLDGVRIFFDNGDIAHLRPSGNAPQLRIYSVADRQARADEIVAQALAEPHGIFRSMQQAIEQDHKVASVLLDG